MFDRRHFLLTAFTVASLINTAVAAEAPEGQSLPTIVLVGDSIRMGYAPFVAEMLKGKANVVFAEKENGGDTTRVLSNLDRWIVSHQPTVVHFNCGLHDLKLSRKSKQHQVSIEDYEKNLREIVDRLQKETKARLIFATTTPIQDDLHAKRGGDFDRHEDDVVKYNEVALKVMKEEGVKVDDLHAVVTEAGVKEMQRRDGTHYSEAGSKRLAEAVVKCVTADASTKK